MSRFSATVSGSWLPLYLTITYSSSFYFNHVRMSMLDKFRKGAQKAGIQATAFLKEGSSKLANESQHFVQGFTLPGEAEKAAKVLESFLGTLFLRVYSPARSNQCGCRPADPEHPESALNSIPKAVLQRARGTYSLPFFVPPSSSHSHPPSCSQRATHPTATLYRHRPPLFAPPLRPWPPSPSTKRTIVAPKRAAGLAMFSVLKAGFVFSGKAGSGLVIARLPDGSWSAPSCIATGGVGWGLQIGADITDFVMVLNSEEAVRAFALGGNVTIGGNVSAAAGPIGTGGAVQATLAHPAPMFSYSKSKGAQ